MQYLTLAFKFTRYPEHQEKAFANKTTIIVNKSIINGITISKSSVRPKKNMSVYGYPTDPIFSGDPSSFYR